jgi:alpha-mannosidase
MPRRKPKDPERSPDLPHNWIERHIKRLEDWAYYKPVDINSWEYRGAHLTGAGEYRFISDWKPISLGEMWGGPDRTVFFKKLVRVPASFNNEDAFLELFLDGGEAQLSINGHFWQGLDWKRRLVPLGEFAIPGEEILLEIEAFIINYPYDERRKDAREEHRFDRARFIRRDRIVDTALNDFRFLFDAYLYYYGKEESSEIEEYLLFHLEKACRFLGPGFADRESARQAAAAGSDYLREKLYGSPFFRKPGRLHICGHSHLDIVYLWPVKETFRKNARTASNMLSLMREFPEFHFSNSQPYLYEKLKEQYPQVFQEVRERIKEGRWEAVGAMYLEPDGNLPGAESLVRHLLFGQRFLKREFGFTSRICWLPDVFGIMYTLPQILREAGVDRLVTAKLNIWNDVNRFPHDSFRWRGPDGSEVLTHFTPSHFGQSFSYGNLETHWKDYREKYETGDTLFIYGWADGGGGPTREMVEMSLRSSSIPGIPDTTITTAEGFFEHLSRKEKELAVWDDELYLEAHRGTLTSKGDLKWQNRKAEFLYRNAEIISSIAYVLGGDALQEQLNEGWKLVLLNQFHDTITGSHSPAGVPDIKADYDRAFSIGEEVLQEGLSWIAEGVGSSLVFNTLSWKRDDLLEICTASGERETGGIGKADLDCPLKGFRSIRMLGELFPLQYYCGKAYTALSNLPSLGWHAITLEEGELKWDDTLIQKSDTCFETPLYTISFDVDGRIASLWDKGGMRELLFGPGNDFQLFEDDPGYKFSAWDIAYHLEEYSHPVGLASPWHVVANGPHFAVLAGSFQANESIIDQEIWFYQKNRRIDFKTRVDWKERKKMLKVAFPLALRSRHASYDLPFGYIERPTHSNTSWEEAKFEVCGHKWADISEANYGVSLINDSKYGYDARENQLRLSLLRGPVRPDPDSDIGEHHFTYAILPHQGDWRAGGTVRSAYELNCPPIFFDVGQDHLCHGKNQPTRQKENREEERRGKAASLPHSFSFLESDTEAVLIETIKKAEDSQALIIRAYEGWGGSTAASINLDPEVSPGKDFLRECNLLEELSADKERGACKITGGKKDGGYELKFRAGEIKSIYLPRKA